MAGQKQVPDVYTQKRLIKTHLGKKMVKGQTWYLIDSKWVKCFKEYVGLDEAWNIISAGDDHPGPIDNTPLLIDDGSGDVHENLIDELDYILVPEEVWQLLVKWYGVVSDKCIIPRKVVEFGLFVKQCKVEVYLLELRLCKDFRYEEEVRYKFSKGDTIGNIETVMRKTFNIPDDAETRLWSCFTPNTYDELSKSKSTVQYEGLFSNQLIVIETRKPDGSWIRQPKKPICYTPTTSVTVTDKAVINSKALASAYAGTSSVTSRYSSPPLHGCNESHQLVKSGLCGLRNLGNTCFMNSVIQCMSNCPQITKYFLNNEYFNELNEENPLGMKGEIAKAFGELIKTMWSGKHTYTVPHNFKLQVSNFAPQFCGYQQHDSQELLTFLLDGLHEDLNRINKKPYIELREADGRPDREVAKEAWGNYRKRNDSIIVDSFHGLLKSTVVCPECDKVSVTFDPFCYLSLPLPCKRERHMKVTLFPYFEDKKKPMNYKLMLPKKGRVKDLVSHLGLLSDVNPENMIVTEVIKHHFHKIFALNESLDEIEEKDSIFVYEVPPLSESQMTVPVYLWESNSKQPYSNNNLFGYPFFICIPKRDCTYGMLYDIILKKLSGYLRVQGDNIWWNGKPKEIPNGETSFFQSNLHMIENEEGCSDTSPNEGIVSKRIFSFYLVTNKNSTSEVIKIHNDGKPIHILGPIGKSYIVAKWLPKAREMFYCEKSFEDSERTSKQNKPQKLQLRNCLELYTTKEKLGQDDAWYCPSCKKHQQATKKFDLWGLPRILIIHLKRFSYNRYRRDKIDTLVDFPLSGLNMSEYVINPSHSETIYDLIGVCNHYGGMGGGHYTAYCQNQNDHKWYLFDDSKVTEVTENTVVSHAAYVLFYMRRNC